MSTDKVTSEDQTEDHVEAEELVEEFEPTIEEAVMASGLHRQAM